MKLRIKYLLLTISVYALSICSFAQDETDSNLTLKVMKGLSYSVGAFEIINKGLNPATRKIEEKKYIVKGDYVFGGYGIRYIWHKADSKQWFGTVINTYNPKTNLIKTSFYSKGKLDWMNSEMVFNIDENGVQKNVQEGEDSFGKFVATHTTMKNEEGFEYTHLRSYDGGQPFYIDGFSAKRIK
ncbi:hypothetical protein AADZ91_06905 [Colwelliaceae bacterium 6441]